MNATFYSSLTNPSTRFINNLVYAAVALIGALDVVATANAFTVGGLTKFLSYANQYTKPFNEISGVITELKSAFACAARIFELIDATEEESDEGKPALQAVNGKRSDGVWGVMDELMETLKLVNRRAYDGVMRKLSEL